MIINKNTSNFGVNPRQKGLATKKPEKLENFIERSPK